MNPAAVPCHRAEVRRLTPQHAPPSGGRILALSEGSQHELLRNPIIGTSPNLQSAKSAVSLRPHRPIIPAPRYYAPVGLRFFFLCMLKEDFLVGVLGSSCLWIPRQQTLL